MAKEAMIPRANRTTVNAEFEAVDAHLSEYVVNVSRTGALIRSKDPLPVGTRVNLRFSILLDEVNRRRGCRGGPHRDCAACDGRGVSAAQ